MIVEQPRRLELTRAFVGQRTTRQDRAEIGLHRYLTLRRLERALELRCALHRFVAGIVRLPCVVVGTFARLHFGTDGVGVLAVGRQETARLPELAGLVVGQGLIGLAGHERRDPGVPGRYDALRTREVL